MDVLQCFPDPRKRSYKETFESSHGMSLNPNHSILTNIICFQFHLVCFLLEEEEVVL